MKATILNVLVGAALCSAGAAGAQTAKESRPLAFQIADFKLQMTLSQDSKTLSGRGIGYDARASEKYDSLSISATEDIHEDKVYPGNNSGFPPDFYFEYPDFSDNSRVMVLPSPATAQVFSINYIMDVGIDNSTWRLSWDPSTISPLINAIWVRPLGDTNRVLVDLTKQSFIDITMDARFDWARTLVTVYHNMTPPSLDVRDGNAPTQLLSGLGVYPNPIARDGNLSFTLSDPATVRVVAYDAAGRVCLQQTVNGVTGANQINLTGFGPTKGAMLVHIDANGSGKSQSQNVMIMKD